MFHFTFSISKILLCTKASKVRQQGDKTYFTVVHGTAKVQVYQTRDKWLAVFNYNADRSISYPLRGSHNRKVHVIKITHQLENRNGFCSAAGTRIMHARNVIARTRLAFEVILIVVVGNRGSSRYAIIMIFLLKLRPGCGGASSFRTLRCGTIFVRRMRSTPNGNMFSSP